MAIPVTRTDFQNNCLGRLGWPTINVELTQAQIDDRIDEALFYFNTFHSSGNEKMYFKYQVQQADITNGYFTIPSNIIGAISIFDLGVGYGIGNVFNVQYQLLLNEVFSLSNFDVSSYYISFMHLFQLQEILTGRQPIRYTRTDNKVYLDTDWTRFNVGDYLILECYQVMDPTTYTSVWSDQWLLRYATALLKKNWAQVLGKYVEVPLVGGMKLNADKLMAEALNEIEELEQKLRSDFEVPAQMMIG